MAGSAKLTTHNKDMEVENVAGRLDIADTHGDIKVPIRSRPREEINIANESGEVDLTLPGNRSSKFRPYRAPAKCKAISRVRR